MSNLEQLYETPAPRRAISIMEYQQRRYLRRLRVAKRMAKRFPMFAAEFMQAEFPGYSIDDFVRDITPNGRVRKRKSLRRPKSPLKRMGRWPLVEKCMNMYANTGDEKYLIEAQQWRNKLYLRYELLFKIPDGTYLAFSFIPDTPYKMVIEISKIKGYQTREELESIVKETCKYIHTARYAVFVPEIIKTT